MKKIFTLAAMSFAAITALATPLGGQNHDGYNGGGGGGGGGAGVAVVASQIVSTTEVGITTNASLRSGDASSTAFGGASTALGGNSGVTIGAGAGSAVINNSYKQSAAGAYAPPAAIPRTSCRLAIGGGGSDRGGSFSGGIPIGNDQTCLTGSRLELMDKVNAQFGPTFGKNDYFDAICLVEGMDATKACIDYKASKPPVIQNVNNAYTN